MNTLSIEQIITFAVLSLWFLFPLGMFYSVIKEEQTERYLLDPLPKIIPTPPNEFKISDKDEYEDYDEDDDFIDENEDIDTDYRIPNYI